VLFLVAFFAASIFITTFAGKIYEKRTKMKLMKVFGICTWTTSFRQNLLLQLSWSGSAPRRHFNNTASYNSAMNRAA